MAGFVGICGGSLLTSKETISEAIGATVYSAKTQISHLYSDANLILTKSFFHFFDQSKTSARNNSMYGWIDGEIYHEKIAGETSTQLIQSYQDGALPSLLRTIDGVFIAIIYDSIQKEITIITDRYGLKPLYIYHKNGKLIFTPELKSFLPFKEFNLQFRKELINGFVDLGHLIGNDTWFEGVELLEPASVYCYNILSNNLSKKKYWTWADNPRNNNISIQEAADEMSVLLKKSVLSRTEGPAKLGISLSGGLDSRAILASVYQNIPVLTYTFGLASSPDVVIARQVANTANVPNKQFEINVANWLQHRFPSVWKTDGMLNLYHMHYPHIMQDIQQLIDINISGFLGDVVLGGSYLEKVYKILFTKKFLNKRINAEIAMTYYGQHYARCSPQDPYFDIDTIDPYLIYNRGRRFVIMGIEEPSKLIPQRMPFMATELMEFAYSLPDNYRYNSNVYNKALQQLDLKLFATIPSASTGMLVSQSSTFLNQLKSQFIYYTDLVKVKLGKPTSFVDYHGWIKEPETSKLISEMLNPKTSLYANFTDKDYNALYMQPHLKGPRFYTQKILSALTIEVWLQQVFNKKHIPIN